MIRKSKAKHTRKRRELPQHLRPLASLVELANLLGDEEVKRFGAADRQMRDAHRELFARRSNALRGNSETRAAVKELLEKAASEEERILEQFSHRVESHEDGVQDLIRHMWMEDGKRPNRVSPDTLFNAVAAVRSALRAVAENLIAPEGVARLPDECYLPPALLQTVNGKIRVTVFPVSHWLLPMLDGLEVTRLGICEACHLLYVARRRDQLACSRKCGDTVYMRRYRRPEYRSGSKPTASAVRSAARRTSSNSKGHQAT